MREKIVKKLLENGCTNIISFCIIIQSFLLQKTTFWLFVKVMTARHRFQMCLKIQTLQSLLPQKKYVQIYSNY